MARETDDKLFTLDYVNLSDLFEDVGHLGNAASEFPPEEPGSQTHAVPPPPPAMHRSPSELRLKHMSIESGASQMPTYVWGQADAFELPGTFEIPRAVAPPMDLTEVDPRLRETVRPGRFCA